MSENVGIIFILLHKEEEEIFGSESWHDFQNQREHGGRPRHETYVATAGADAPFAAQYIDGVHMLGAKSSATTEMAAMLQDLLRVPHKHRVLGWTDIGSHIWND